MFHWRTHFSFNTDGTTKHVRLPILDHNTEEAVAEERYPSGEISLTNDLEKDLFARSLVSLPANMITKDATPSHTHLAKISSALVTTNGKDHDLPSGVGASTLPKHVHLLTVDRNSEGTVAQQLNDTAPLSDAAATDIQTQGQSTTTFSYDLEHNKPRFFGVSMPMPTPAPLGDGLSIDDHKATYFRNSSGNADLLPPTALTKENPNENLSNDLFRDHSRPKAESVWSGIESSSDSRGSELPRTLIYKAMDDRIFKASSHVKNSSETIISFRQKKVVFKNALTRLFILKASPMLERPPEFELPHGCDGLHSNDLFVCVDASYLCFGENGIPSSCIASSNISSFSLSSSGTLSSGTVSSSIVSSTPESGSASSLHWSNPMALQHLRMWVWTQGIRGWQPIEYGSLRCISGYTLALGFYRNTFEPLWVTPESLRRRDTRTVTLKSKIRTQAKLRSRNRTRAKKKSKSKEELL
ncbi:uncharacterized protein C8R40DRAFT_1169723 [Lentinula edodes]|uniref:uncharacterized protein n=1 Tax=Lentinula edodes TaxID=5353 RepID=UPI001E8D9696|nr:uncharacterized protein C8R40DRAFT_1169723 [Lentinula edodes]KAH7876071.1 hypothetical protein C8R40DRAFT_1169723 [Lentinula edodes]